MKALIGIVVVALVAAGLWFWMQEPADAPGRGGSPGGRRAPVVVTEPVSRQLLVSMVEALGTARANESVTLSANLTDTIRRVNFEDGDFVQAGDVLVEIINEEEEVQLAEARANHDEAMRQLRRFEDLGERGIAAVSDVDEARSLAAASEARLNTTLARLQDRLIRAPFSGVLGFREVSTGTLVTPGTPITTLDDVSQIKLDFTVPETVLGAMVSGGRILARSVSFGDRGFEGVIRAVGSRVDPVTRAAVVRAVIPNEDRALRPGMLLTVRAVAAETEALVVPETAVVQVRDQAFVYVVGADQRVQQRWITLGMRQASVVEITSGLQEGEQIVTEGVIKLRDGIEIRLEGSPVRRAEPGSGDRGRAGPGGQGGGRTQPAESTLSN